MAKLILTTKNGRHRRDHEFAMNVNEASDPIERARFISAKKAQFDNVVNWKIVD